LVSSSVNSKLKYTDIFQVGGTSGIGEWTFRSFIKHTNSPRAYLIGRNRPVAEKIISDALSTKPEAKIDFIPTDCSLLKEVSRVCQEIKTKEDEISGLGKGMVNLLVMSQSSSGLGGRSGMSPIRYFSGFWTLTCPRTPEGLGG
jgi:hypothetical protein